jgi:hypothetical protein
MGTLLGKVSGVYGLQSAAHRWVGSATAANSKVVVILNDTVLIVLCYCLQESRAKKSLSSASFLWFLLGNGHVPIGA